MNVRRMEKNARNEEGEEEEEEDDEEEEEEDLPFTTPRSC